MAELQGVEEVTDSELFAIDRAIIEAANCRVCKEVGDFRPIGIGVGTDPEVVTIYTPSFSLSHPFIWK
jgi:hypothetical protein